uniref:Heparan-alpha-glucosaminide N-acetyltransferase catalytic domain-containing protein n=2 Tax=Homalodisca liturata TaxID=320908 RepID=A0A1B6JM25_9HEMI
MWPEEPDSSVWRGLDLTALEVDEAYLNVTSFIPQVFLYSLSADCHQCPYSLTGVVHQHRVFTINTKHSTSWRLYSRTDNIIAVNDTRLLECEVSSASVGQFGVYDLIHNNSDCIFNTASPPVNIYYSLVLVVSFLLGLAVLAAIISLRKLYKEDGDNDGGRTPKRSRVRSLDTFRGITLVLMVFVNDGAGGYWFLEHATWHGLLMADVLFPWFMWIMGVCIPISIRSQFKRGIPRYTMFLNTLQRACTLFLLGLMLNTVSAGPELSSLRVFGVLQRFGVVYLLVSTLSIFLTHRPTPDHKQKPTPKLLSDIVTLSPQWIVVLAVLVVHSYLVFYVPIPGCPLGYLDAGGIQDMGLYANCTGGVSRYIDELLVGEGHLYQVPTVSSVYHTAPFDPEGILGCLTSVVQVFLGVQAGTTLLTYSGCKDRVARWIVWGIICGVLTLVLTFLVDIPINKNLWTTSYVFATSSLAFFLFAACYLLVDHFVFWNGSPFIYPGMNSILVYVGHTVCYQMFPWHWRLQTMNTHLMLTVEAVWGTALWVIVSYWLYTKQCFISV